MEEITEVMPISEVTPKLLEEFARKTNSFYQTVEQILDDVPECRIRYGVNDRNNTIVFGTLAEEFDVLIKKSNYDFIPGELRVMASVRMGESLYDELSKELNREVHIALNKVENITQTRDVSHKTTNAALSATRGERQDIMSDWTPKTNTQEQDKVLAYIHKDTREAAKTNPTVAMLANAMLESAKEQMDAIAKAGLTTESKTREGVAYTDKMVVKVEPAEHYNKDTEKNEPILDGNGNQVYRPTIEYSHAGNTLTEFGKNKLDEAGKAVISSMNVHKWTRTNGKAEINCFKQDEIASAPLNKDVKAIAAFIEQNGFIAENDRENPLRTFSVEANKQFRKANNIVLNANGEYVNDAYAKYVKDDYGERVEIYNHSDNTLVELGVTAEDKAYARVTNFDLNEAFEPRADGETPAKVYINTPDDAAQYIALPEIQKVVSEFKGFDDNKEKSVKKDKKDKSSFERA